MSDSWTFLRQGDRGEAVSRSESMTAQSAAAGVTYPRRAGTLWARGGLTLVIGLSNFFGSIQSLAMPSTRFALFLHLPLAATSVCCVLLGAWMWLRAWHRDVGTTVTESGVKRTTIFTTYWAEWSSLAPFEFGPRRFSRQARASARIEGQGLSRNLRNRPTFTIWDIHGTSLATMSDELNVWRQRGRDRRSTPPTSIKDTPVQRIQDIADWSAADIRLALICAALCAIQLIKTYNAH